MKANIDTKRTPPGDDRPDVSTASKVCTSGNRHGSGPARVRRWALVIAVGFAVGAPVGALTAHAPQWAHGVSRADDTFIGRVAAVVPSSVREVATVAWGLIRGGESVPMAIADAVFRAIPEREAAAPASPLLDDGDIRLVPELRPYAPPAPRVALLPPQTPSPGGDREPHTEPKPADGGNPFVFPMITRLREAWAQRPNLPMGLGGFGAIAPAVVGGPRFAPLPDDLATLWLTPGTPDARAGQPLAALPPIRSTSPDAPRTDLPDTSNPAGDTRGNTAGDSPGNAPAGGKSRAFRPQASANPSADRTRVTRSLTLRLSDSDRPTGFTASFTGVLTMLSEWSIVLPQADRGIIISISPGRVVIRRVDPG